MAKLEKVAGATSEIWQVFIADSSSATGAGLTGVAFNTSGLTAYYHRDTDTTATAITLVTMTAGTFTSSGFVEIDSTHMPGWYQFCPPNAALASGAKSCAFHLKGVTNMAPLPIEVQLTAVNPDSATAFVTSVALASGQKVDVDTIKTNPVVNGGTITFPTGATLASTTNITAGTIATVTNLTNAPTAGDLTATMKTSVTTAATAATPAAASVTGNVGGTVAALVGSAGIKKNTAKAAFMFLMTDATTHAPKTGLTVAVTRSLDGAAFAGAANTPATEVSNGWYKIDLAAGDLNGNTVAIRGTASGADDMNIAIVTGP